MTIWKFKLDIRDYQTIRIPPSARLLCVREQYGELMLWALVDQSQPAVEKRIAIHGTGSPVPEDEIYVDTAVMTESSFSCLVWHVFDAGWVLKRDADGNYVVEVEP